jgi:hypothetical protein
MFGPLIFSFFALVHGCIALGALLLTEHLLLPAICLFVVEAVTAFDNGATVIGGRIGVGEQAERLSRKRFLLHAICIGLLLPVYSGIGGVVAFSQFGALLADIVSWLLVVMIGVYGYLYQYKRMGPIMPVNYFGCLRYAQSVTEATRWPDYEYSGAELAARGKLPLASVLTTTLGLVLAFLIGWFGDLWVPFIATAIMYLAAAFPLRSWGPLATSCLEIIFSGGMLYSLWAVSILAG